MAERAEFVKRFYGDEAQYRPPSTTTASSGRSRACGAG